MNTQTAYSATSEKPFRGGVGFIVGTLKSRHRTKILSRQDSKMFSMPFPCHCFTISLVLFALQIFKDD